jgi:glycosyltransferase involved in cell wall biosynthesis
MNICVISPPDLRTKPEDYGGMEFMAGNLAIGLLRLGHTIVLLARGDSMDLGQYEDGNSGHPHETVGYGNERELPSVIKTNLRNGQAIEQWASVFLDFSHNKVLSSERPDLPIINNHQVMSLMGSGANPVFISQGQKDEKFPGVEGPVIHYGLDLDEYPFYDGPRDDYLLYMGQIIPEKRIQTAIEAAVRANIRIRVCGPWWGPPEYSEGLREMERQNPGLVSLEDSIGGAEKIDALQKARALIHLPGDKGWCEAGAIVVLEALAVGTPVICSPNGCLVEYLNVPEPPGVLVADLDDAVQAVESVTNILPSVCRKRVEEHFTQQRFALEYAILAKRVADGLRWNT